MSLCGPNGCCVSNTNETEVQVKSINALGMQSGDLGLPEPSPSAGERQFPTVVPPPPVKKDESSMLGNQVGAAAARSVFVVEIEKTPTAAKVGLDVDHGDEQTLEVMLVKGGLVQIYNEGAIDSRKIKVGDRIIEVNGITGDNKKMLENIGREAKIRFVIKPAAVTDELTR